MDSTSNIDSVDHMDILDQSSTMLQSHSRHTQQVLIPSLRQFLFLTAHRAQTTKKWKTNRVKELECAACLLNKTVHSRPLEAPGWSCLYFLNIQEAAWRYPPNCGSLVNQCTSVQLHVTVIEYFEYLILNEAFADLKFPVGLKFSFDCCI